MYVVEFTSTFKKELKKAERRGKDMRKMREIITLLCSGDTVPEQYRDHALKGRFSGYRECHIEPDWLLMYARDEDRLLLFLTRTGTHADLFGR